MRGVGFGLLMSMSLLASNGGTVTVKGQRFQAEVAHTDAQKAKGLMYRATFPKDACMIFLYDEDGQHSIWMKNCLISLDVAWVAADGTVVETVEGVPPCSPLRGNDCPTYGGTVSSRYFIEFGPGTFKRLGVKRGDKVAWDLKLDDGREIKGGASAKAKK